MTRSRSLRLLAAVLLLAAAGLFVYGTRLEHAAESRERVERSGHKESGEGGAGAEAPGHKTESFLGVNPDSAPAVAAAVVLSAVLAGVILAFRSAAVSAVVGAAALVFAIADVREAVHQAGAGRGSLTGLAVSLAVLHASVAVICGALAGVRRLRDAPG